MTNERKPPKIILTVLLVGGERISHTYDVPPDLGKAKELVKHLVETISSVMAHRKEIYLRLENPDITYNPDNILGIKFDIFEAKELEEAVEKAREKARRKAGFVRD